MFSGFKRFHKFRNDWRKRSATLDALSVHAGYLASEQQYNALAGGLISRFEDHRASPWRDGRWRSLSQRVWTASHYRRCRAIHVMGERLYVGLCGIPGVCGAVYEYDGNSWTKIGGDGLNGSWSDQREVISIACHDGKLIAGTQDVRNPAALWQWDGHRWSVFHKPESWVFAVNALKSAGDRLFAAVSSGELTRASQHPPRILSFDARGVEDITPGWNGYVEVYDMHLHSDGALYCAMIAVPPTKEYFARPPRPDVWRHRDGQWLQICGPGAFQLPSYGYALRFASLRERLIFCGDRLPASAGDFTSIWGYDDPSGFAAIGLGGVPFGWSKLAHFNAMTVFRDRVVVGAGGVPGSASVWSLDDEGRWVSVGRFGPFTANGGQEYAYQLAPYRDGLVATFGSAPGSAQVWLYN